MEEKKQESAFQKLKRIMDSKESEPDYIPVNDLLAMLVDYNCQWDEIKKKYQGYDLTFDIYTLKHFIILFDKYEIFDYIIEGIDAQKAEKIVLKINEKEKLFFYEFANLFKLKFQKILDYQAILEITIFFMKTLDLMYKMFGNLKNTKDHNGKPMLVDDMELAQYKSKYKRTFFSPDYKVLDIELMLNNIAKTLLDSGDEKEYIEKRNAIYSTYMCLKIKAQNG